MRKPPKRGKGGRLEISLSQNKGKDISPDIPARTPRRNAATRRGRKGLKRGNWGMKAIEGGEIFEIGDKKVLPASLSFKGEHESALHRHDLMGRGRRASRSTYKHRPGNSQLRREKRRGE